MAGLDDLSRGDIEQMKRDIRQLQTAAPLQHASIGANGLRVYGGGGISIENGGLSVVGSGTFTGTLYANGTIAFTGTLTQSGPSTFTGETSLNGPTHINGATDITGDTDVTGELTVTGPTHLNGTTDIAGDTTVTGDFTTNGPMKTTGTLSVEGVTTLKNDLNVEGDGKIIAGDTIIRPSGTINFGDTLTISPADGFGAASISDGFAKYTLTPADPVYFHQFQGGAYIDGKVSAQTLKLNYASLPTSTAPANLFIDTDGTVKRSTA